jgi:uncharacterized protein YbjT (DUF2867 family)
VRQRGHSIAPAAGPVDVAIHLAPAGVRTALDDSFARAARLFFFVSVVGASAHASRRELAVRGRAEELVRASGLPFLVLEPDLMWGPGDVFTNEIAHLLSHLPFDPIPRGGELLEPVAAADVARALVAAIERPDLWNATWTYAGPEALRYGEIVARIAEALHPDHRRTLRVPSWAVRAGAALEERLAGRPRGGRELVDGPADGVVRAEPPRNPRLPVESLLRMTIATLRGYLGDGLGPDEQLGSAFLHR